MSFTTTFVGKVKEFSSTASEKAKELTARAKTNISIVDVESDMEGLFRTLGKLVYDASKTESSEETSQKADELIEKIKEKELVLNSLRARSQELRKVKMCACGRENSVESDFCSKCGAKLD